MASRDPDDRYAELKRLLTELQPAISDRAKLSPSDTSEKIMTAQERLLMVIRCIRLEFEELAGFYPDDPKIQGLNDVLREIPNGSAPPAAVDRLAARLSGITADLPHTAPSHVARRRSKDDELEATKTLVRKIHAESASQAEICARLGTHPRPPQAAWRLLPWPKAYAHPKYHRAVKSWISKTVRESELP